MPKPVSPLRVIDGSVWIVVLLSIVERFAEVIVCSAPVFEGDADGDGEGLGDGEGDGLGEGDGDGLGDGEGLGDGVGVGVSLGVGDGDGDGEDAATRWSIVSTSVF